MPAFLRALQALRKPSGSICFKKCKYLLHVSRNFIITQPPVSEPAGRPEWCRQPHAGEVKGAANIRERASIAAQPELPTVQSPQCYTPSAVTGCPCTGDIRSAYAGSDQLVQPAGFNQQLVQPRNTRQLCPRGFPRLETAETLVLWKDFPLTCPLSG